MEKKIMASGLKTCVKWLASHRVKKDLPHEPMGGPPHLQFTVDCEPDYGWRTETTQGIEEGLLKICDLFAKHNIVPIVFVAPQFWNEIKVDYQGLHPKTEEDLYEFLRNHQRPKYLRFHKFARIMFSYLPYSSPKNHTSLLRHMWLKEPIRDIFYFHPFDIVKPKTKPPNLFCKLWYSQPERAYKLLEYLIKRYS